jgi:hypothetical protein
MPDLAGHFATMVVEKMKELTHLQIVLRRKNRRLQAQHAELLARRERICALLSAFDDVLHATSQEKAQRIARAVLEFDDREAWRKVPRRA